MSWATAVFEDWMHVEDGRKQLFKTKVWLQPWFWCGSRLHHSIDQMPAKGIDSQSISLWPRGLFHRLAAF